jgi:hypothetical protein
MKSIRKKPSKALKPSAKKKLLEKVPPGQGYIVLGGVLVKVPRPPGKPRHHTERQIQEMFRDYYAARRA